MLFTCIIIIICDIYITLYIYYISDLATIQLQLIIPPTLILGQRQKVQPKVQVQPQAQQAQLQHQLQPQPQHHPQPPPNGFLVTDTEHDSWQ